MKRSAEVPVGHVRRGSSHPERYKLQSLLGEMLRGRRAPLIGAGGAFVFGAGRAFVLSVGRAFLCGSAIIVGTFVASNRGK